VVVAIAVPAIAIGTRSSSRSVPPATSPRGNADFRIALVTGSSAPPCESGALPTPVPTACVALGRTLTTANDVRNASVGYDNSQGWLIIVTVDPAALQRIAAQVGREIAVVVGGKVVSVPTVNAGITGTAIEVVQPGLTRNQAIALATEILGRAPAHVATAPDLVTNIELPGSTFVAGTDVHGTLVIDNNTDHPITLERPGQCHIKWAVGLSNDGMPPHIAFTQECSSARTVLAPGTNRFPITVSTTNSGCSGSTGSLPKGFVHCLPGGGVPPLEPGNYEAMLVSSTPGQPPSAPAVLVRLTAAP